MSAIWDLLATFFSWPQQPVQTLGLLRLQLHVV